MSRRSADPDVLSANLAETDHGSMVGVRILIVSDVRLYREALACRLGQNDHLAIVGAVERQEALRESGRLQPDLVLLDMGEWHGLDLANTLLQQQPALGILAIAVPERPHRALRHELRAGVEGQEPSENSTGRAADGLANVAVAQQSAKGASADSAERAAEEAADDSLRRQLRTRIEGQEALHAGRLAERPVAESVGDRAAKGVADATLRRKLRAGIEGQEAAELAGDAADGLTETLIAEHAADGAA
jgi:DNA-binding NarL/FixJ family response regulator